MTCANIWTVSCLDLLISYLSRMKIPRIERIPKFVKSFYFIVSVVFAFWLLFFDSIDLFTQINHSRKVKELEKERQYYEDQILEVKNEREELETDDEQLEKIAREKYLMKKDGEDVYVVVEKKKK
jgi:cell division protein DivIC